MKVPIKALIYTRVSSIKQRQKGESPENQERECLRKARDLGYKKDEVKVFEPESFSGKHSTRPILDEVLAFAEQNASVECVIFKCIDRLSRDSGIYREIKEQLASLDVDILDADGVIQPSKNILHDLEQNSGGKFRHYDWAQESSSDMAEALVSQVAEDERKRILKRTIPRAMELATQGAIVRSAGYGFKNAKIPHPITKKMLPSQEVVQEEAIFVRRAFELKAEGWSSREVVDELNNMGYRSRKTQKWNKERTHVVGEAGGNQMDTKKLNYWLGNVSFAGFNQEHWTGHNPVEALHEPIVSLNLWNKANKGKRCLVPDSKAAFGWRVDDFKHSEKKRNYSLNNPDFPFKELVRCPSCKKNLKGSASKGKSGKYFPSYHCSRGGHKRVSINPSDLQSAASKTLSDLTFSSEAGEILEITLKALWTEKLKELNIDSVEAEKEVVTLEKQSDGVLASMASLSSPVAIQGMEKRYLEIKEQEEYLRGVANQKKYSEGEISQILKYARYFVEHLDVLALQDTDRAIRNGFWKLIFPENPTLDDLKNGTPQISPVIEIKGDLCNQKEGWQAR